MNNLIYIDFGSKRQVIRYEQTVNGNVTSEPRFDTDESCLHNYVAVVSRLQNRFDLLPKTGVVVKNPVSAAGWLDTYGRGNFHNSKFQYRGRKQNWNRPQPFPTSFERILKALKQNQTWNVGLKSDPFMWIDCKYNLTRSLLAAASRN